METITIDFHIPTSWSELSDKQLRYVYQLIADNFTTDDKQCQREQSGGSSQSEAPKAISSGYAERSLFCRDEIKTLCLLRWSGTKVVQMSAEDESSLSDYAECSRLKAKPTVIGRQESDSALIIVSFQ